MVHQLHFANNLRVTDETKASAKWLKLNPAFIERKILESIFWGISISKWDYGTLQG